MLKLRGRKVWDMFWGDTATCNGLLIGKNWPEQVRELSRKYGEEHTEEKKAYDQEYNRREVERESESCGDTGGEGEGGHEDKLN